MSHARIEWRSASFHATLASSTPTLKMIPSITVGNRLRQFCRRIVRATARMSLKTMNLPKACEGHPLARRARLLEPSLSARIATFARAAGRAVPPADVNLIARDDALEFLPL